MSDSATDLYTQLTGAPPPTVKPRPVPTSYTGFSKAEADSVAAKETETAPVQERTVKRAEKDTSELDDRYKKLLDAEPAQVPQPKPPVTNPWEAFASPASLFGLMAAAFTKTPAIAGLKAATAAITAEKAGNQQAYEQAMTSWRENNDLALKRHELMHQDYQDAAAKARDDLEIGESEYKRIAAKYDDQIMLMQLQAGNLHAAEQIGLERARLANEMRNGSAKIEEDQAIRAVTSQAVVDKEKELGRPLTAAEKGQVYLDTKAQEAAKAWGLKPANEKATDVDTLAKEAFKDKNGRAPGPGDAAEMAQLRTTQRQESGGVISDEAAKFAAKRVIAGDEGALTGFARSAANITKVTNEIVTAAKEAGLSPEQVADKVATFKGIIAADRTLGTREANMRTAAHEVENMAPLALAASEKVDRSQYPRLNSVLLAAEQHTGGEDVVRFGLAANSLIYTYAKFLNPTGIPTDADKARATDILSTAWTQGQFAAAVDQIKKEIQSGEAAIGQTRGDLGAEVTGRAASTATPGAQPVALMPLPMVLQAGRQVPDAAKLVDKQTYTLPNGTRAVFDAAQQGFHPLP